MRFAAARPLGLAPATATDYRELARRRIPRQLFDYVDGGAYDEATMRANVADLQKVLLRQVVMRDVSVRDPAVEVLGQRLALPVILAPVGLGGMLAPRAEGQAARAAVVPALRHARPQLRRGPHGARADGRLAGAHAHRRPRGHRRAAPRHAQRD